MTINKLSISVSEAPTLLRFVTFLSNRQDFGYSPRGSIYSSTDERRIIKHIAVDVSHPSSELFTIQEHLQQGEFASPLVE